MDFRTFRLQTKYKQRFYLHEIKDGGVCCHGFIICKQHVAAWRLASNNV